MGIGKLPCKLNGGTVKCSLCLQRAKTGAVTTQNRPCVWLLKPLNYMREGFPCNINAITGVGDWFGCSCVCECIWEKGQKHHTSSHRRAKKKPRERFWVKCWLKEAWNYEQRHNLLFESYCGQGNRTFNLPCRQTGLHQIPDSIINSLSYQTPENWLTAQVKGSNHIWYEHVTESLERMSHLEIALANPLERL